MTRRRAHKSDEAQLVMDFAQREHPAVEHARAVRVEAGLAPSLTSPDLLGRVRATLQCDHGRCSPAEGVRRAS